MYRLPVNRISTGICDSGSDIGQPAVFLKMSGCPFLETCTKDCPFDLSKQADLSIEEILNEAVANSKNALSCLVIIKGSDPLSQSLRPLLHELLDCDFRIRVYTTGPFIRILLPKVSYTLFPQPGRHRIGTGYDEVVWRVPAFGLREIDFTLSRLHYIRPEASRWESLAAEIVRQAKKLRPKGVAVRLSVPPHYYLTDPDTWRLKQDEEWNAKWRKRGTK